MQRVLKAKIILLAILSFIGNGANAQKYMYTEKECPVVGNTKSRVYHIPGGQFYVEMLILNKNRKDNRKCFRNQKEANDNGYRKSKK